MDGVSGNDANSGLSESTAFRTIGKATSIQMAGDTVRIKAGLYRERLSISRAGTAGARITVGAHGDGPVVVDASTAVNGWSLVSGQIFRAPVPFAVTAVVVDDVALFPEFSQAALRPGRYYHDPAVGQLYLWLPTGGSPAAHDVGVVKDDSFEDGILVNGASYLTLYGLTVRFAGGHGMSILGNGVRVEKCRLRFNGKAGVSSFGYGSTSSTGLQVIKSEVYFNVIRNWPRGRYKWGGWAMGVVSNGTPDPLYQGNVVYRNGGEGLGGYAGSGGVIRDNIVYDNWSVNVYVDNRPNVVVDSNFIYCHAPNAGDLYNNEDPDPGDGRSFKRLRAEGIMTADENYGLNPPANLNNITIANNVIVNCRRGLNHYAQAAGSGLKNVKVLHNTVVAGVPISGEDLLVGIATPYNNGNNTGSIYRDNIVYGSAAQSSLLYASDVPTSGDRFKGLAIDHNLWFHAGRSDPFHWGPDYNSTYDYTHAEWLALPGTAHGAGDLDTDPLLVNASTIENVDDKQPAMGSSPPVNAGISAGVAYDYNFCARPVGPGFDMGAFESGSVFADLWITKTDGQSTATPGAPVTYTITVGSAGPAGASSAIVTDTFPAALSNVTWSCSASLGSSCGAATGSGNISQSVSMPSGGTVRFTVTGTISINATGSLVNTAAVIAPPDRTDPNLANNSASDTDTLLIPVDLAVTKSDGQATVGPGQLVTYSIVVTNNGPNAANGATVTDTMPSSLISATWTCTGTGGGSCSAGGSGNINDTINLPVGGTATYTLSGTLSHNPPPPAFSNTAGVNPPSGHGDFSPANNTATDTDLIVYPPTDFFTVTPCRVVDTRNPAGPTGGLALGAGSTRTFLVAGICDVPSTATAVSVNLTVVGPTAVGNLTVYRGDAASAPLASSINFTSSMTRANNAIVSLATDGSVKVKVNSIGAVHFVLDVNGYFE